MKCGDEWYSAEEWAQVRLSSKNHVDAPIIIPTSNGNEVVHLLMSHPTPPVFDPGKTKRKTQRKWNFGTITSKEEFFYDDAGKQGGLASGAKFVMMGDQTSIQLLAMVLALSCKICIVIRW